MKPYEEQVDLDPLVVTEHFDLSPVASVYSEFDVQFHRESLQISSKFGRAHVRK